jgi:hypothetical protein
VSKPNHAVAIDLRSLLAASALTLALGACATASSNDADGGKPEGPDATIPGRADAAPGIRPDAAVGQADATPVMNPADAGIPIDANPNCTPVAVNLLANADFDLGPGSWQETSGGGFPLITSQDDVGGVDADSGTFLTWLGGYLPTVALTATDIFFQDVTVPGDATPMTVTGKIFVDSAETLGLPFDTLVLELVNASNGALLEEIESWSNLDAAAAWVPFNATIAGNYAGQTVRLRFTADFDSTQASSFLLDTMALNTTSCP